MAFGWLCGTRTKASRRYTQRILAVMSVYVVAVFATTWFVRHHHPVGAALYALAAVPTVPILGVLVVVALYLKEEQDEFQRMVVVRSLLGAIAGVLAMSAFVDFLRSYNAMGALAPFTEFVVFWVLFGVMQGVQSAIYSANSGE